MASVGTVISVFAALGRVPKCGSAPWRVPDPALCFFSASLPAHTQMLYGLCSLKPFGGNNSSDELEHSNNQGTPCIGSSDLSRHLPLCPDLLGFGALKVFPP